MKRSSLEAFAYREDPVEELDDEEFEALVTEDCKRQRLSSPSPPSPSPNVVVKAPTITLSPSQKLVLDAVLNGESLFFTGAAGTGKSHLISVMEPLLVKKFGYDAVFLTASTGVASVNIGGTTINSFAGVGLGEDSGADLLKKIRSRNAMARERWLNAKVLVIEECGMISPDLFEKLDFIARSIRGNLGIPFGGIQVILCGDFYQLPPVNNQQKKNTLEKILHGQKRDDDTVIVQKDFIFETRTWRELTHGKVYVLKEIYRQKDPRLITLLNDIRGGVISEQSAETYKERVRETSRLQGKYPLGTVKLYGRRESAQIANEEALFKLDETAYTLNAVDNGEDKGYVERLAQNDFWMAPTKLTLKNGAAVMLITNMDVACGIVNGTTGIIVKRGTDDDFDDDDESKKNKRDIDKYCSINGTRYISIRLKSGRVISVHPMKFEVKYGGKVVATRIQMPLILAYAVTIHKSQGLNLENLLVTTSGIFERGQLYTALSRATNLEGLFIVGGNVPKSNMIKPHEKVTKWWNQITKI